MVRILAVEDEEPIAKLIEMSLNGAGYSCRTVGDGLQAADIISQSSFDLILLDIMLPGADGYELLEYIKPTGTPVIFLTAKAGVEDRVKGLRLGADDYIEKPFAIIELLARVESVLRRAGKLDEHISALDVEIDLRSRSVTKNGAPVQLTNKEFELLLLFVRNKNAALFRETIYERIWESDYMGDTRTVDLHVQRLRKKLGWEEYLTTVYKIGYRLQIPEGAEKK